MRRIVSRQLHTVEWDVGSSLQNEWVLATVNSEEATNRLIAWINSKEIDVNEQAVCFDRSWTDVSKVIWGDVLKNPAKFRLCDGYSIIGMNLKWLLEFGGLEVARFGRWRSGGNRKVEQGVPAKSDRAGG